MKTISITVFNGNTGVLENLISYNSLKVKKCHYWWQLQEGISKWPHFELNSNDSKVSSGFKLL